MIKKLGFMALLSISAHAQVDVLADGTLQTQACAYGRGNTAISGAKTQAAAELIRFIKGNKHLKTQNTQQHTSSSLTDDAASLYQQQRVTMLEGLSAGSVPLTYSEPSLLGNDTCMLVSLNPSKVTNTQAKNWQQTTQNISVTVIGQGWKKEGRTALANAEQDALQRAVSQVVGVWLRQQHTQSSSTSLNIVDDNESTQMQELVAQQLTSHSEGLVKEWQTLQTKTLENNGVEVTIMAVVEKSPLIQKASKFFSMIGSPRVQVIAPDMLKKELKMWLSEQGIEVGEAASIAIYAKSDLLKRGNNRQLSLSADVRDLAGNIYGRWKNDPSLISLPKGEEAENDLMTIHLASDSQAKAFHRVLNDAFTQIVARGGLVREVLVPSNKLTQPEKLHDVLATIGGVSDVSVYQQHKHTVVNLRFKGNTGELAHAIDQVLPTITDNLLKVVVEDDFTIRYK